MSLPDWRRRMDVRVSNAEIEIQVELGKKNLATGYQTQIGFEFTQKEFEDFGARGTVVDGIWSEYMFIIFIDGPPHLKNHAIERDAKIGAVLEARGYTVKRFPYKPPLRATRKGEIIRDVKTVLTEKGYFKSNATHALSKI